MTAAGTTEDRAAPGGSARRRSVARLGAVQALYQLELNPGRGAEAVIGEFVHHRLGREIDGDLYGEADEALFADIVRGVAADRERLDETISAALSDEWPLSRLETILRLILEAGAYELVHRARHPAAGDDRANTSRSPTPSSTGKEPGLANGVLDRLARTLRARRPVGSERAVHRPKPETRSANSAASGGFSRRWPGRAGWACSDDAALVDCAAGASAGDDRRCDGRGRALPARRPARPRRPQAAAASICPTSRRWARGRCITC